MPASWLIRRGGTSAKTLQLTSPSASCSRRCAVNMYCVTSAIARRSSARVPVTDLLLASNKSRWERRELIRQRTNGVLAIDNSRVYVWDTSPR